MKALVYREKLRDLYPSPMQQCQASCKDPRDSSNFPPVSSLPMSVQWHYLPANKEVATKSVQLKFTAIKWNSEDQNNRCHMQFWAIKVMHCCSLSLYNSYKTTTLQSSPSGSFHKPYFFSLVTTSFLLTIIQNVKKYQSLLPKNNRKTVSHKVWVILISE